MDPDKEFDMDAAVSSIGADLFQTEEPPAEETPDVETPDAAVAVETAPADPAAPVVRAAPKSWAKETHELWGKIAPEAQAQIEKREQEMLSGLEQYKEHFSLGKSLHEVILPYRPMIDAAGLDPVKAVGTLLSAHHRLTNGSPEQRMAAFQQLGVGLGIIAPQQQAAVDPAVRALQERQDRIESSMTQRDRQQYEAKQVQVSAQVGAFAKDHPYFDDVADDIIVYLGAGTSLEDAYEKAVYANPVTRQKEIARLQTENEAKLREKAKTEAEAARKAAGSNVRSRDTRKAPTEPLGKMDDTMREALAEIKSRTH